MKTDPPIDDISDRHILITGCSSGIGLCVAHGLKKRGYQVITSARKKQDVKKLHKEGFHVVQIDLSDPVSVECGFNEAMIISDGTLYGLFNNGAFGQPGAVEDLSREVLLEQFETNVFGTHQLTRYAISVMRKQGYGRIIQNSSVLGFVALKYRGAYNASKYALEGLSDTMRLELKGTGIHVSLIEPGPIESRFRVNAFKMFKKNIDSENSIHKEIYSKLAKRLVAEGPVVPFTLPPEAVYKKVIHALESEKPKIRYYVTFPTYLFGFLNRVLPNRWLDIILNRI